MQVLIGGFFATMILTCLHAHGIFSEVDLSSATGISAEQAGTTRHSAWTGPSPPSPLSSVEEQRVVSGLGAVVRMYQGLSFASWLSFMTGGAIVFWAGHGTLAKLDQVTLHPKPEIRVG